ncbi:MAG: polyamine aminopropyltransferase [Bacteroidetes bacterium]|nr:polyamine aminopropyltransferase [Bacteroidota bacterium]
MLETKEGAMAGGRTRPLPLLFSVFVIAACGIVYELMIATVSSYLLGDSIYQFSVTIGLFLTSMGIGSYLSRGLRRDLLLTFIAVELLLGAIGGSSALLLYYVFGAARTVYQPTMYLVIAAIGILMGLEIPILTRLLSGRFVLRVNIANVLSFDYLGGLIGSLAFPLILLPYLGLIRTALVVGMLNVGIAAVVLVAHRRELPERVYAGVLAFVIFGFLTTGVARSSELWDQLEQQLYRDPVVYSVQTPYQHITITQWRDDIRLFLDGHLQFSSVDEYRYHESLVHPAMGSTLDHSQVLVLGGGDGLAVRELLKWPDVKRITLVDLDPNMTNLFRSQPELVKLNGGSLNNPRVTVINADAFKFLEDDQNFYGVIVADLPDPRDENLQKLYTEEFYRLAARRLSVHGVFVTQATSPYFAPEAFWCIYASMKQSWPNVVPYHTNVPSFGDWGFIMASGMPLSPDTIQIPVPTRFLDGPTLKSLFVFPPDMPRLQVQPNSLMQPVLPRYYLEGWQNPR